MGSPTSSEPGATPTPETSPTPAERLAGRTLATGWVVLEILNVQRDSTGGYFSTCYLVEKGGQKAFLKALDYWRAFGKGGNPAQILQEMTEAYNFECDILRRCGSGSFDRVVKAFDFGIEYIDPADPFTVVQYVVFELADSDVRAHLKVARDLDMAWALRTLHHVATGLSQLHSANIAHQDLKPSNVLVFPKNERKVGDLGRAAYRGSAGPHDGIDIAGQPDYAPPELVYHSASSVWDCRRFGCDLYLLGSMISFFFAGNGISHLMLSHLPDAFKPQVFHGPYHDVLPHLRVAFDTAVQEIALEIPEEHRTPLVDALRQLCDPDPLLRGHPKSRAIGNAYSLERFVALFDLLAHRAAVGVKTSLK